jgi:CheY-like chemotaxis protein/signal transduction histidine kinase
LREHWLVALLLGIFIATGVTTWQYQRFVPQFNQQIETLMGVTSTLIQQALKTNDQSTVDAALKALTQRPGILYGVVVGNDGKRLAKIDLSPKQTHSRWLTEALFGMNYPIEYRFPAIGLDRDATPNGALLLGGYIQVEVDTDTLIRQFFREVWMLFTCIVSSALILATLISWISHFQTTRPLGNIIATLNDLDISNPGDIRILHEEMVLSPALTLLTDQVNRLLEQVSTNMQRRERAEDDLRKNLASLEHIVAERTDALRNSNQRLQTLVNTMESRIEHAEMLAQFRLDFLAVMAHEIKITLSGVMSVLVTEIDNNTGAERLQPIETAYNANRFLVQSIDDMLDLSRLEANKLKLKYKQLDLGELVEQVTYLHHHDARVKGVELSSVIAPRMPNVFIGDEARIRQVLNTLTQNILKFSDHGELRLEVHQKDAEAVMITFRDNGISITEDAFKVIFNPVSDEMNLNTATTLNDWGLSLVNRLLQLMGAKAELSNQEKWCELTLTLPLSEFTNTSGEELWLSKLEQLNVTVISGSRSIGIDILLQYLEGWKVTVKHIEKTRTENKAHCITYSTKELEAVQSSDICIIDHPDLIPADQPGPQDANPDARTLYILLCEPNALPTPATLKALSISHTIYLPLHRKALLVTLLRSVQKHLSGRHVTLTMPERNVLLVEDNPISRTVSNMMLRSLHCRVVNAHNGLEALEMISSGPFDIIFMDCHMPEMDGYEATALIRENITEETLPIIALTTDSTLSNRKRCLDAGMSDLLSKPFSWTDLETLLSKWV